ncbi:hypothetical protein [Mycobacterium numidiamassiliense]|nr:hypothetical protein [Mycobacterium numidiamassiliense]
MTQRAAAEATQRAFQQQQERDAYIGFYNAIDEFVSDVWAEARRWQPTPASAALAHLAAPMKENIGTGLNNVLAAESKVTFYGSEATQKAANDVVEQVGDIQHLLGAFEVENPQYPNLSDAQSDAFAKLCGQIANIIRGKLQIAHLAFRRAARADLGLPRADDDVYNPLYSNLPRGVTPIAAIPPSVTAVPAPLPSAITAPAPSGPPR